MGNKRAHENDEQRQLRAMAQQLQERVESLYGQVRLTLGLLDEIKEEEKELHRKIDCYQGGKLPGFLQYRGSINGWNETTLRVMNECKALGTAYKEKAGELYDLVVEPPHDKEYQYDKR